MSYNDTLGYLYSQLPMYQRLGPAAYKNSLDNTLKLDALYNHPHRNFRSVHVAGTNGKGSVSHMLASILQAAGYKTGLYTSPHLKDFRERIRVNGEMISKHFVETWIADFRGNNETWKIVPSFFELTAAMAFDFFNTCGVDIAVIEVGLGGRLDSTNIITPEVSVITNIGFDHVSLLGNTLKKIAFEKAGIIKNRVPVVIGVTQEDIRDVFISKAEEESAPLYFADGEYFTDFSMQSTDGKQVFQVRTPYGLEYPDLKLDLLGLYQRKNLPAVLKTGALLSGKGWKIDRASIYEGLSDVCGRTGLMGRWQIIGANPMVICDTGHNYDGIRAVTEQIDRIPFRNLHMVIGFVADKDISGILKLLPDSAIYYFTRADLPRALDEKILAAMARECSLSGESYPSVADAFSAARMNAGENDLIFIGGSTFVVAEIL